MSEEKLLHAEISHLKELLDTKLTNICKEIGEMNDTLKDHNGRLKTTEKLIEQAKGAKAVVSGFWGLVGGAVIAIIIALFNNHLKGG